MNFLFPSFLFALFTLSIPIIIHLFHFRRFKKVYFSNTSFLSFIKNEKKTKNKLKHLIILILRLLAIASLVFAFAQPFIPVKNMNSTTGQKSVSIYIDNSPSMNNISSEGSMLNEAKNTAKEIIKGYENNCKFQILTNQLSVKEQRFYSQEKIIDFINGIKSTSLTKNINTIINRQDELLNSSNSSNKISYLISDFQKSSSNFRKTNKDSTIHRFLIPVSAVKYNNLFIDSAWFDEAVLQYNQSVTLKVKIKNNTEKAIENSTITLKLNDKQKAIANFSIPANQNKTIDIPFSLTNKGWNKGLLNIDDYPVVFDDNYFFSFHVAKKIKILQIFKETPQNYIKTVFKTDSYFEFEEITSGKINYSSFEDYSLIILNELESISSGLTTELNEFVKNEGNILFIPSSDKSISIKSYNQFLKHFNAGHFEKPLEKKLKVISINHQHQLMDGIFEKIPKNLNLPVLEKYYPHKYSKLSSKTSLLKLENGENLLSINKVEKGNLFILNTSLKEDWSNFAKHAIFVPLLYKTALYTQNSTNISYIYSLNKNVSIITSSSLANEIYHIKHKEIQFIPKQRNNRGKLNILFDNNFNEAGFYQLIDDKRIKTNNNLAVISLNYNRKESELETYSKNELSAIVEEKGFTLLYGSPKIIGNKIKQLKQGKALWKIFLLSALFFFLTEILLLRFWK